ncbi:MAG: ATP-binding protein [Deinococcota bacterium]
MSSSVQYEGLSTVRRRYTTIESWRAYVNMQEPLRPALASAAQKALWTPGDREAYDETRRSYHRHFDPLETPDVREIHAQIGLQLWENLDAGFGAKAGGAVDGDATLGKTTIVAEMGKRFEHRLLREHPVVDPQAAHLAVPVVYITLPARATPKTLNLALARFYNLLLPRSVRKVSTDDLNLAITEAVEDHGTQAIIVDDLHYLRLTSKNRFQEEAAQVANDHLKHLANILDVTFLYAGINLETSGLFDTDALLSADRAQTGGRFLHCKVTRFENRSEAWLSILEALERKVVLERLEPGTLPALGDYLFRRTQGGIGDVVNLIRKAANLAVGRNETITEKMLEQMKSPRNAQFHYERLYEQPAAAAGSQEPGHAAQSENPGDAA